MYIAAFAPDSGESLGSLAEKFSPTPIFSALAPDAGGYLYIDRAKFHDVFCADVPQGEALVMAAAQKPFAGDIFKQLSDTPAWRTIPAWYLISTDDKAINPDLQRFMAKRMNAKTSEIKASHVAYISQPKAVVEIIEQAATATLK